MLGSLNWLFQESYSTQVVDEPYALRRARGEQGRCIYAAWHSYLWHCTKALRGQGVCTMVSSHRDGEIIARVLARWGFTLARGSSTRGGARALRDFARAAKETENDLCVTVDGPRGPAREIKDGVLFTAALTGLPIVPMGLAVQDAWELNTWDRLILGKPLTRVAVTLGPELHVPRGLDREELVETYRPKLAEAMRVEEARARSCLRLREPVVG
ncbi:MAG: hypothetical protein DHS20C15_18080 [Planctomycetota bacterium]|nr:MAG: hypothetical protein DHS20C15_18080 [Planctomycetota bacterium]